MRRRLTALAEQVMARLDEALPPAGDPVRAEPAARYMRNQFRFLGISSPALARIDRAVRAGLDRPTEADLASVAYACWDRPEREYQYFACGYLRRYAKLCSAEFITTAEYLIVTKSWWDTVDSLATHVVGPMVRAYPELVATMDRWSREDNIWLVRAAIIHQLLAKQATDAGRLFSYCAAQAGHRDFFVRKAIGWALRDYAKTDPDAVRSFVDANRSRLSPLSVREALKNL